MNSFAAFLYHLAGAVPEYLFECPASERQRYRNMAYAMGIVGVITAFSAHHAALLCGLRDPVAWLPAMVWAMIMIACDRIVILALAHRSDRQTPLLPIVVRVVLVVVNALILGFFALLAYNQQGFARIRFEQKQHAIAEDNAFFEGQYRLGEKEKDVAETATLVKDVEAKLALIPSHITQLRDQMKMCDRDLASLQASNVSIRHGLRGDLASFQSKIDSLGITSAVGDEDVRQWQASAARIRVRLAALDSQEALKRRECADIGSREALAARQYYGPLRQKETEHHEQLRVRKNDLAASRGKLEASMAESEAVSASAYGFNLSGEGGALLELLKREWFARIIALVVWLISVCLETLPILQKVRARGGPYDQRVAAEERVYEAKLAHRFDMEVVESAAATEKARSLMPDVIELSKPLTLFMLAEDEIARTRSYRERVVKADPSRMQDIEDAFHVAVGQARKILRDFLSKNSRVREAGRPDVPDFRATGRVREGR